MAVAIGSPAFCAATGCFAGVALAPTVTLKSSATVVKPSRLVRGNVMIADPPRSRAVERPRGWHWQEVARSTDRPAIQCCQD